MDSSFIFLAPIMGIAAIIIVVVMIWSGWDSFIASKEYGYWVRENNTEYMQIRVYDERGTAKVQELLNSGWNVAGISSYGNDFTLVPEENLAPPVASNFVP